VRKSKLDLSTLSIPDEKKRRGSFVVRQALRRVVLHQHRSALKAAAYMLLLLPIFQGVMLVGILNSEPWMLLLCLEGALIALLAASQLSRPTPENRAIGYGIALLNVAALSLLGLFLGAHILWVTSLALLVPVSVLVLLPTRSWTLRVSWALMLVPMFLLLLATGAGRVSFEMSKSETDPARRLQLLQVAWVAGHSRGLNDSERALLRMRMAQAAFESGEYERAFRLADDGAFSPVRALRPIPQSPIGEHLLDGLLLLKAQAYYNWRWDDNREVTLRLGSDPIEPETLAHENIKARWAW